MKTNAAPESFLIKDRNYSIISCSPETLIEKVGDKIITKPIAGTLEKSKSTNIKKALSYFRNNIKETKEHNMIIDMERSDLSKICKPGTVKLSKMKYVEEYKDLYHYVTEIKGMIKKNINTKRYYNSHDARRISDWLPKNQHFKFIKQTRKRKQKYFYR